MRYIHLYLVNLETGMNPNFKEMILCHLCYLFFFIRAIGNVSGINFDETTKIELDKMSQITWLIIRLCIVAAIMPNQSEFFRQSIAMSAENDDSIFMDIDFRRVEPRKKLCKTFSVNMRNLRSIFAQSV